MIKIQNKGNTALVTVDGAIGESWFEEGNTLKSVKAQLSEDLEAVDVEIKSMGGDGFEAFAIYDHLRSMGAKVTTKIVGATASAGTIVAMAGDERLIAENAKFLIHNASAFTDGKADDHKKTAEMLEAFDEDLFDLYKTKTNRRKSEIKNLMADDIWISAKDAVSWGFATGYIKKKVKNQIVNKMETVLNHLKVENEAGVMAAITNLQTEAADLKNENKTLKGELEAMKQARNETIVNNAVSAGKIAEADKANWLGLLNGNFDAAKAAIENLKKPATIKNFIEGGKVDEPARDYDWYMKNDAKALMEMKENDSERFAEIVNTKVANIKNK